MSKLYCVYMHVAPFPDKRIYIGKTCQYPLQRWRRGYDGNIIFQHAIDEFGNVIGAFNHYILAPNGKDWLLWNRSMELKSTNCFNYEEACELEAMWIAIYDSINFRHGFNRQSGGDKGYVCSESYKEYVSEMRKGWYQGNKNPFAGQTHTTDNRQRLSEQARQRTGSKNGMWGKHHTEEAKELNRQAHLGRYDGENNPFYGKHHSVETRAKSSEQHSKPISMYTLDGTYVKTFPSALVAAKEMGVAVQSISMCATKNTKTSCGRVWRYFACPQLPKEELPEKHAFCKTVAQYSLTGEFIRTFDSLTEAAQTANTTITNISRCVNGVFKQAGGYIWRNFVCDCLLSNELPVRQNRCRAVEQYDSKGALIKTYHSLKEAALALGVSPEAVCRAVKGKTKPCAGFVFRYSLISE